LNSAAASLYMKSSGILTYNITSLHNSR
jgi:hypothetical protein